MTTHHPHDSRDRWDDADDAAAAYWRDEGLTVAQAAEHVGRADELQVSGAIEIN